MLAERSADGVKVAVVLLALTVPVIGKPPRVARLMVAVFSVDFNITAEKVTVIAEFTATAVAASAGEVEETIGGVVSAASVVATTTSDRPKTFPAPSMATTW